MEAAGEQFDSEDIQQLFAHRIPAMKCLTVVAVLLLVAVLSISVRPGSAHAMTENHIMADIKFLSQATPDGAKPSRLRALLLADLRRALPQVCRAKKPAKHQSRDNRVRSFASTLAHSHTQFPV